MTFRSDEYAVRERNEALERDLKQMERELEELREISALRDQLQTQFVDQEREIKRLRSRLYEDEGGAARKIKKAGAIFVLCVFGSAMGAYFATKHLTSDITQQVTFLQNNHVQREQHQQNEFLRRMQESLRSSQNSLADSQNSLTQAKQALENSRRQSAFDTIVRPGSVTKVTGQAPVSEGEECHIRVFPAFLGSLNCRVEARCGNQVLFGASSNNGYLVCGIEDGRPTYGRDTRGTNVESDPMFELNLPENRVVVSDEGNVEYSVEITLRETE